MSQPILFLRNVTIYQEEKVILTNVNLECAWRRYKHILNENEYKDNTYTIL